MQTVLAYFREAVERQPQKRLFIHADGSSLTYGEAAQIVAATAAALSDMGIRGDERVVTYLEDTIPLALFDLACVSLNIIPAPISPVFSVDYVRRVRDGLAARCVFTTPALAATLPAAGLDAVTFQTRGRVAHVDLLGSARPSLTSAMEFLGASVARSELGRPFMIQPTSGSTGDAKLVLRPHVGFARYAKFVGHELGTVDGGARFLQVAALTHAFGLHMFTTALSLGAEIVVPTGIDTQASLDEVRQLDPSILPMTPRVLRSFCRQNGVGETAPRTRLFGPSARAVLTAGGKSDAELLRYASSQGLEVFEFYGSSETSIMALTPCRGWREGWAGRVVADCEMRIAKDGEVLVQSPGQMLGYFGAPDLTREAYDADGFYRTGDVGEIDGHRYLRILGRKRDTFNTPEGSNIYPERIEMLLEAIPGIRQAFLVGDQRPYLAAFLCVDGPAIPADAHDGHLEIGAHASLYGEVAARIAQINAKLETVERIVAVDLFARPFGDEIYAVVGPAKVRRNRPAFGAHFRARMDALYAQGLKLTDPRLVHPTERRLRPRAAAELRYPRLAVAAPVWIRSESGEVCTSTRDISLGGLSIVSIASSPALPTWPMGTRVQLALRQDGPSTEARVMRVGAEHIGLAFVEPSDLFLADVAALLKTQLSQGQKFADRREQRVAALLHLRVSDDQGWSGAVVATNMSTSGAFLLCTSSEMPGRDLTLSLARDPTASATARLARRAANGAGIQFVTTSPSFQRALASSGVRAENPSAARLQY